MRSSGAGKARHLMGSFPNSMERGRDLRAHSWGLWAEGIFGWGEDMAAVRYVVLVWIHPSEQ